jgi:catechol 2,3-dioxygenase
MTAPVTSYGIAPRGFRLPPTTRVGPVRLQVADLARSVRYYGEVLGLHPLERSGAGTALGVEGETGALVDLREQPGAAPAPLRGRLGLYHFAVLLPDRSALGRFVAHLDRLGERFGASDHLVSEALYLRDPDGLGIEVYADRPRDGWRVREGELLMATDPLDLDDLVRAARGAPWTGMPPGTTVGHVHLHVGDLGAARQFYHETLGLDAVVWSYPGALFLSAGGYHHHLGVNTWAGPGARPPPAGEAQLLEWTLVVPTRDDLAAAAARLSSGREDLRPEEGIRVADPWGTALRIVSGR